MRGQGIPPEVAWQRGATPFFPRDLDLVLSEGMYRERGGRGPVLPLPAAYELPGEGTAFTAPAAAAGKAAACYVCNH